jgi:protein-S-isoprenylcysteine O-methyltransferase Ste14
VNALELKVPPLILVLVLGMTMWFVAMQLPSLSITSPGHHGLAAIISGVGIFFILAGAYEFQKAKTTLNPTTPAASSSVVASGIYRVSRNPMYVASCSPSPVGRYFCLIHCHFCSYRPLSRT